MNGNKSSPFRIIKKIIQLFDASRSDSILSYGMNCALREMTRFPKWLALPVWQQHGFYAEIDFYPPDVKDVKWYGIMLVFSKRILESWQKHSDIPCYIGGLMLARYRRFKGWEKHPDASGTLFFASHSGWYVKIEYSIQKVHEELQALPEEYQPVTISLHEHDYAKLKNVYENLGYKVVTAGRVADPNFPKNFYENLSRCKYTCSNSMGTYVLYAVEMGIPFFFLKNDAEIIFEKGNYEGLEACSWRLEDDTCGREMLALFGREPRSFITPEQQEWVAKETGNGEEIDFEELRKIMLRPRWCIPATIKMIYRKIAFNFSKLKNNMEERNGG